MSFWQDPSCQNATQDMNDCISENRLNSHGCASGRKCHATHTELPYIVQRMHFVFNLLDINPNDQPL